MRRFVLIALLLGAFGSSGCNKVSTDGSKTTDDDKSAKKKSGDDDDDDDKPAKKKKKKGDDDDDDDKTTDKKKKGDDDDDDKGSDDKGSDGTGVDECDEYLKLFKKCVVDPAPAAAKKALQDSITTQTDTFKKSATTSQGKTALASSCQSLIDSTKKNCKTTK